MSDPPSDDRGFDYPRLMREALRQVPREALRRVERYGLPGAHHFYLSFRTDHPEVEIADFLRDQYPEEMTVVLQHQYWDLEVDDEAFSVGLTFSGRPEHIRIPFQALTAFIDPFAEFGLRFDGMPPPSPEDGSPPKEDDSADSEPSAKPAVARVPAEVVSIDKFRKK